MSDCKEEDTKTRMETNGGETQAGDEVMENGCSGLSGNIHIALPDLLPSFVSNVDSDSEVILQNEFKFSKKGAIGERAGDKIPPEPLLPIDQESNFQRLRQYILHGSESDTYYTEQKEHYSHIIESEDIDCLNKLLDADPFHVRKVLSLLERYSIGGRVPKERPILNVLAICATHKDKIVQYAAYSKVSIICNIPTKLFMFVELCQQRIPSARVKNPPSPQCREGKKTRKRTAKKLSKLNIGENVPQEQADIFSPSPSKYKKVNTDPEKKSSGWGRRRRKGVGSFYTDKEKDPMRLLYLLTKFKRRYKWSHKQVIRLCHPRFKGEDAKVKKFILKYITRGYKKIEEELNELKHKSGLSTNESKVIRFISIIQEVSQLSCRKDGDLVRLLEILQDAGIRKEVEKATSLYFGRTNSQENPFGLRDSEHILREHIPAGFLKKKEVWVAMLKDMPMTALIRNLGRMGSLDLFSDPDNVTLVVNALEDKTRLYRARLHPMKILIAIENYKRGKGLKGILTWRVNDEVSKALDRAFNLSLKNPNIKDLFETGKRLMVCLDLKDSTRTEGCVGCVALSPMTASIAMAVMRWNMEKNVDVRLLSDSLHSITDILNKENTINGVKKRIIETMEFNFSADWSLPMNHASDAGMDIDAFIFYTDSQYSGSGMRAIEALESYNATRNMKAKLVVCALQSNHWTFAEPGNVEPDLRNVLKVVGFNETVPHVISAFVRGV